jgi:molybdate transport system substrate-binding protein
MRTAAAALAASLLLAAAPAPRLTIAAAANLSEVFQTIGVQFESATGIHPVFSFGSTAQLTQQIENGAPFDLFAAADTAHIAQLDREGRLARGSNTVYATGILAVWIPPSSHARIDRLAALDSPDIHVIAVARPELAPYGAASIATLRTLGLWDRVKSRIVYADNINMARQYGASGNADAVFTAYSLVMKEAGRVLPVNEKLHTPIAQSLGIIGASPNQANAQKFTAFLLTGKGRDILAGHGYRVPHSSVGE